MRPHGFGNRPDNGNDYAVAELPIRLRVGDWDPPRIGESHQPSTLARGQPPGVAAWAAPNQDLTAVFIVSR